MFLLFIKYFLFGAGKTDNSFFYSKMLLKIDDFGFRIHSQHNIIM